MLTIFKRNESPYWQIRGTVRSGRKIKTINKKSTNQTNKKEAQKVCDEINREILLDFDKQNYMTWSECLKKMRKNQESGTRAIGPLRPDSDYKALLDSLNSFYNP